MHTTNTMKHDRLLADLTIAVLPTITMAAAALAVAIALSCLLVFAPLEAFAETDILTHNLNPHTSTRTSQVLEQF